MNRINNGLKNLDKQAYDFVCNWFKEIDFNPVHQGIDYSLIIRFYLWDKVGRSLRIKHNLSFNEVEEYKKDNKATPFYFTPLRSNGNFVKPLFSKRKLIYIPFQGYHTELLIKELGKLEKFRVISKQITKQTQKKDVVKELNFTIDKQWSLELVTAVFKGLNFLGIDLIDEDIKLLKTQIEGSVAITELAFKELKKYKPSAVFVHSDNHPPYINYTLVAKSLGIPTFTYQHGLDCEHFYLDDCFADYIAIWSNNRKQHYQLNSKYQPLDYKVIGNIFLQPINIDEVNPKINNTILFITRPHLPIKCYSPSQNHLLGLNILEVILKVLKGDKDLKLIIKPHPMDNFEIYKKLVDKEGLTERLSITNKQLPILFKEADIIITEDSTAGAEAMHFSKPIIHAHLAKSGPVLPFVNYGAALSGRTEDELFDNINEVLQFSDKKLHSMQECQKTLVEDLIPTGSVKNLVNFIIQNI